MYLQLQLESFQLECSKSIFYNFGLAKWEILKINEKNVRKTLNNCHIGNIVVEVVPEGCIYEIKFVALVMKHISSKYSPTNGIWARSTVAMDIFLWNFSFYQDMLPYIHIVCKPHSHTPYRCLKIDNYLGTGLFRIIPP